MNSTYEFT